MAKRSILVTGAESGIGAACAVAFGEIGDRVTLCYYKDEAAARGVADRVRSAGGEATIVQCDVSDEASVAAAFTAADDAFGPPVVLVNSAGINMAGIPVREMTFDRWREMLDTDLSGAFLTSRRFLSGIDAGERGASIVHISSIHAEVVRAGGADYDAAKAGLNKFMQTLAVEEAPRGIRVNAIEPGMILTPMNRKALENPEYRKQLEANIPIRRAGTPEDVAGMARWLASDEAGYVTGAEMVIDGGLSLLLGQGA